MYQQDMGNNKEQHSTPAHGLQNKWICKLEFSEVIEASVLGHAGEAKSLQTLLVANQEKVGIESCHPPQ